jgi:hypothetical protein
MSSEPELTADYFVYRYKNDANNEVLAKALEYLNTEVCNNFEKLYMDQTAINASLFIGKIVAYEFRDIEFETFEKHNFHEFLGALQVFLFNIRDGVDFLAPQEIALDFKTTVTTEMNLNQLKVLVFKLGFYYTNLIMSNSIICKKGLQLTPGLKAYKDFLSDEKFIKTNLDVDLVMWNGKLNGLISYFVLNVSSMSQHSEETKEIWHSLNATAILF